MNGRITFQTRERVYFFRLQLSLSPALRRVKTNFQAWKNISLRLTSSCWVRRSAGWVTDQSSSDWNGDGFQTQISTRRRNLSFFFFAVFLPFTRPSHCKQGKNELNRKFVINFSVFVSSYNVVDEDDVRQTAKHSTRYSADIVEGGRERREIYTRTEETKACKNGRKKKQN